MDKGRALGGFSARLRDLAAPGRPARPGDELLGSTPLGQAAGHEGVRSDARAVPTPDLVALDVHGLSKEFGSQGVVNQVSFTLRKGEVVSLLGPSGCGKTTTLRSIAGFYRPDAGSIALFGRTVAAPGVFVPPEERGLSMVFQNYVLWPHMTIFDNIAYGLRVRGVRSEQVAARVAELTRILGLRGYERRYPHELSGGQQQRVAVARSLAVDPAVLLLDEPFSNLDAKLRVEMRFEMRELFARLGTTALYVTHDQEEAMVLSDRILLMNAGRIVEAGAPADLYERPGCVFTAQFFGFKTFIRGPVAERQGHLVLTSDELKSEIALPDGAAQPGEMRILAVRPEGFEVTAADGAPGWIPAQVIAWSYVGGAVDVHLRALQLDLRARVPAGTWRAAGERVQLRVRPQDVRVLPDEPPLAGSDEGRA